MPFILISSHLGVLPKKHLFQAGRAAESVKRHQQSRGRHGHNHGEPAAPRVTSQHILTLTAADIPVKLSLLACQGLPHPNAGLLICRCFKPLPVTRCAVRPPTPGCNALVSSHRSSCGFLLLPFLFWSSSDKQAIGRRDPPWAPLANAIQLSFSQILARRLPPLRRRPDFIKSQQHWLLSIPIPRILRQPAILGDRDHTPGTSS